MSYIGFMKQICTLVLALSLWLAPAQAQDDPKDGFSLIEEGTKLLMRQMLNGMSDALDELDQMAEDMGPAFKELRNLIGDLSAYHIPEVLPNGDIIIRRKVPLQVDPPGPDPEAEIEL